MNKFKAYGMPTIDGKPVCRFETLSLDDLDEAPVVINTAYSAVTLKGKNLKATSGNL